MDAGRDVGVVADPVVVIYRAPGIENGMRADHGTRVYHDTAADHSPRADRNIGRDHGPGMTGNGETLAL